MKKLNKILGIAGIILILAMNVGCKKDADNSEPENKPEKISPDVEKKMTDSVTGVEDYIDSEEELIAVIGEVVGEYSAFIEQMKSSGKEANPSVAIARSATNVADASKQIESFIEAINGLMKTSPVSEDGKINLKFNEKIDIGKMSVAQWFDLYLELADYSNKGKEGAKTKAELKQQFEADLKEGTGLESAELAALLDKYFAINKLYLSANVNSNIDMGNPSGPSGEGSAKASVRVNVAATKINEMFSTFVGNEADISLPVNDIAVVLNADADLAITGEQAMNLMSLMGTDNPTDIPDVKTAKANASVIVSASVCTASKKGGIITVEIDVGSENLVSVVNDLLPLMGSDNKASDEQKQQQMEALFAVADKVASAKISISDGSKEVWTKTYKPSDIVTVIEGFSIESSEEPVLIEG